MRRGRGGDPLNWLFSNYRKEAKNRELPFELTREQFKTFVKQACHYCGIEPRLRHFSTYDRVGGATHAHANGIDRRDNTIGYTLANSVACCTVCNLAKSSLPVEDFEQWILRAAKHIQSRG